MDTNSDPDDALEEVAAARRQLADRAYTPWWYHPILGLLLGLIVLQSSGILGRTTVFLVYLPVTGILMLPRIYRHLSGIDLSASDGGKRGRSLLAVQVCMLIICFAAGFFFANRLGLAWTAWVLAALVTVGTITIGRKYDNLLRAQLRGTAP